MVIGDLGVRVDAQRDRAAELLELPDLLMAPELDLSRFMERMRPLEVPFDRDLLAGLVEAPLLRMPQEPLVHMGISGDVEQAVDLSVFMEEERVGREESGFGPPPMRDPFHGRGQRRERRPKTR